MHVPLGDPLVRIGNDHAPKLRLPCNLAPSLTAARQPFGVCVLCAGQGGRRAVLQNSLCTGQSSRLAGN